MSEKDGPTIVIFFRFLESVSAGAVSALMLVCVALPDRVVRRYSTGRYSSVGAGGTQVAMCRIIVASEQSFPSPAMIVS